MKRLTPRRVKTGCRQRTLWVAPRAVFPFLAILANAFRGWATNTGDVPRRPGSFTVVLVICLIPCLLLHGHPSRDVETEEISLGFTLLRSSFFRYFPLSQMDAKRWQVIDAAEFSGIFTKQTFSSLLSCSECRGGFAYHVPGDENSVLFLPLRISLSVSFCEAEYLLVPKNCRDTLIPILQSTSDTQRKASRVFVISTRLTRTYMRPWHETSYSHSPLEARFPQK